MPPIKLKGMDLRELNDAIEEALRTECICLDLKYVAARRSSITLQTPGCKLILGGLLEAARRVCEEIADDILVELDKNAEELSFKFPLCDKFCGERLATCILEFDIEVGPCTFDVAVEVK